MSRTKNNQNGENRNTKKGEHITKADYKKLLNEVSQLSDPSDGSGVTCEGMFKIDDNPKQYINYLLYLKTRSYYEEPDDQKVFSNKDALPCSEVHDWIEEILERIEIE